MSEYIDGFIHSIPCEKLDEYRRLVEAVAEIWKQHGALEYCEFIADDLHREGTRSFTDLLSADDEHAILFGWVVFPSREVRDLANEKVAADPEMQELMANTDVGFSAQQMAYGGFRPFTLSAGAEI
jgi:uncharacterized protein YbaA (DUF1428 family)